MKSHLGIVAVVILSIGGGSLAQTFTTSTFAPTGTVPPVTFTQCPDLARALLPGDPYYSPNYHCADPGYNTDPGWIDRYLAGGLNQQACFNGCRYNPNCISFAYNSTNNYCRLFGKTVNAKGFVSSKNSDTQYWNLKGCYQCLSSTAPNLVYNPNFEVAFGLPVLNNLTYPGWSAASENERDYQAIPGPYGNTTGVTGISIPDWSRPTKRNNVLVMTGNGFDAPEPIVTSNLITGLNMSAWYVIKYSIFLKSFVFDEPITSYCILNTGLVPTQNPPDGYSYGYQYVDGRFWDGSIWHMGLFVGQAKSTCGRVRLIWRCATQAVLYVDNVTMQEYPQQPWLG